MAVFYHATVDFNHNGEFIKRIPPMKLEGENNTIKRVCVASTIEGCVSSMPGGGESLGNLNYDTRGYYLIFRIDTEKLKIDSKNIISPEELYEKGYVADAKIHNEFWITESFTVPKEDRLFINISDWDEDFEPIIPKNILKIAEEEYYGDYEEAYLEAYKEYLPKAVVIKNLKYITTELKKGENHLLFFQYSDEEEQIISVLDEIEGISYESDNTNIISISANKNIDLTNLFLAHYDYLMEVGDI